MAREGYLLNKELDMQRRSTNSFLSFIMHGVWGGQTLIDVRAYGRASWPHLTTVLPTPRTVPLSPRSPCALQRSAILSMVSSLSEQRLSVQITVPWTETIHVSAPVVTSPPPVLQASGATTSC